MREQLAAQVRRFVHEHIHLPAADEFMQRLDADDRLTRDENPSSHFCVYFGAYDPDSGRVFIGHHKKSGLWLFNGGHIDHGETADEALLREMGEEWGLFVPLERIGEPKLLTITEINNPARQSCTRHYDIWYFVPVEEAAFAPQESLLAEEYHTIGWYSPDQARSLVTDPNTRQAIALVGADFTAPKT